MDKMYLLIENECLQVYQIMCCEIINIIAKNWWCMITMINIHVVEC